MLPKQLHTVNSRGGVTALRDDQTFDVGLINSAEIAAEIVRRWNAFEELQAIVAEVNGDLCDAVADLQGWASCGPEGFTSDEQARMDEYQETIDETAKKLAAYLRSDSQEDMRGQNLDTKA